MDSVLEASDASEAAVYAELNILLEAAETLAKEELTAEMGGGTDDTVCFSAAVQAGSISRSGSKIDSILFLHIGSPPSFGNVPNSQRSNAWIRVAILYS